MSDSDASSDCARPVRRQLSEASDISVGSDACSASEEPKPDSGRWKNKVAAESSDESEDEKPPSVHFPPDGGMMSVVEQIVTEADATTDETVSIADDTEEGGSNNNSRAAVPPEALPIQCAGPAENLAKDALLCGDVVGDEVGVPCATPPPGDVDAKATDERTLGQECPEEPPVTEAASDADSTPTPSPAPAPTPAPIPTPTIAALESAEDVGCEFAACAVSAAACGVVVAALCEEGVGDASQLSILIAHDAEDGPDTVWDQIATAERFVGLLDKPIIHTVSPDIDECIMGCMPGINQLPPFSTIFDESPSCLPVLTNVFTSRVVLSPIDEDSEGPLPFPPHLTDDVLTPVEHPFDHPTHDPCPPVGLDTSLQIKVEDLQGEVEALHLEKEDLRHRLEDALKDKAAAQQQVRLVTEENERLSREGHRNLDTISKTEVRCKEASDEVRVLSETMQTMKSNEEYGALRSMYEKEVRRRTEMSAQLEGTMNRVRELEMWGHRVRGIKLRGQRYVQARRGFEMRNMAAFDGVHSLVTVFQYDAYEFMKEEGAAYAHIMALHHVESVFILSHNTIAALSDSFYASLLAEQEHVHRTALVTTAFLETCTMASSFSTAQVDYAISEITKLQADLSSEVERRVYTSEGLEQMTAEKTSLQGELDALKDEVSHVRKVQAEREELQGMCERLQSKVEKDEGEMLTLRSEVTGLKYSIEALELDKKNLTLEIREQQAYAAKLQHSNTAQQQYEQQARQFEATMCQVEGDKKDLELRLKALGNEMAKMQRDRSDVEMRLKNSKKRNTYLGSEVEKLSEQLLKVPMLVKDVERLGGELGRSEARVRALQKEKADAEAAHARCRDEVEVLREAARAADGRCVAQEVQEVRAPPVGLVASSKYLQRNVDVSVQEEVRELRKKLQVVEGRARAAEQKATVAEQKAKAAELKAKLLTPGPAEARSMEMVMRMDYSAKMEEVVALRAQVVERELSVTEREKDLNVRLREVSRSRVKRHEHDEELARHLITESERITRHTSMSILKTLLKTSRKVAIRTPPPVPPPQHLGSSLDILASKIDSCITSYNLHKERVRHKKQRDRAAM